MTAPASPCTGICRISPDKGWCEGCARTLEEIGAWSRLSPSGKRAVLARLAKRRRS